MSWEDFIALQLRELITSIEADDDYGKDRIVLRLEDIIDALEHEDEEEPRT